MKKLAVEEMDRLSVEEFIRAPKFSISLVLDNIRSMHNVGAAFRIADAFLIEKMYLCGITASPPRKEISKTALGAEDHVEWEYYDQTIDAIKKLKVDNYKIIAIEQVHNSIQLENFIPQKGEKYALIFGHEVTGVDDEVLKLCDYCLEIKQFGVKHSLNVSVTVGIAAWHFARVFTME